MPMGDNFLVPAKPFIKIFNPAACFSHRENNELKVINIINRNLSAGHYGGDMILLFSCKRSSLRWSG
jgi:hypothetical protein